MSTKLIFLIEDAKSSFSDDNKIKIRPIKGMEIKIGKIGRFNIRRYKYTN